ncbi:MAG: ferrochelatase [Deltaproteobacteria bacterium]|nr:ferrochelatase [Deltaproteobacteria bacterium]
MATHDAVLLISFGGPERMQDVRPFLANVLKGRNVPAERVDAVVHHYELIGGRSPLNELTRRQAAALQAELAGSAQPLPVYVGMRNWHPYLADTLAAMRDAGHRRAVGVILAAQQSDASWGRYQRDVAEARDRLGRGAPAVDFAPNWHAHPLFIDAVADRTRAALAALPPARRSGVQLVFTAHSIPVALAAASPYESQLAVGAALIAEQLGLAQYRLAYQSRSGSPREPWLEPDIGAVVREEAARGTRELVVVPLGFVCDHVEVLYDLDIEARQIADEVGIGFHRVAAVNDHPSFIRMLAAVVAVTRRP